jgi:hypothetical protein
VRSARRSRECSATRCTSATAPSVTQRVTSHEQSGVRTGALNDVEQKPYDENAEHRYCDVMPQRLSMAERSVLVHCVACIIAVLVHAIMLPMQQHVAGSFGVGCAEPDVHDMLAGMPGQRPFATMVATIVMAPCKHAAEGCAGPVDGADVVEGVGGSVKGTLGAAVAGVLGDEVHVCARCRKSVRRTQRDR